jgi:hypothetical protein
MHSLSVAGSWPYLADATLACLCDKVQHWVWVANVWQEDVMHVFYQGACSALCELLADDRSETCNGRTSKA